MMDEKKRLFAWYSEAAHQKCGGAHYRTLKSDGFTRNVLVTRISTGAEDRDYVWSDKTLVGEIEVDSFYKVCTCETCNVHHSL